MSLSSYDGGALAHIRIAIRVIRRTRTSARYHMHTTFRIDARAVVSICSSTSGIVCRVSAGGVNGVGGGVTGTSVAGVAGMIGGDAVVGSTRVVVGEPLLDRVVVVETVREENEVMSTRN